MRSVFPSGVSFRCTRSTHPARRRSFVLPLWHALSVAGLLLVLLVAISPVEAGAEIGTRPGIRAPGTVAGHAGEKHPLGVRTERSAALVDASRRLLFDYRLDAAADTLNVLLAREDGHMAAYHGRLWIELLRGFMTEETAYFERFDAYADTLEQVVQAQEEARGETRWIRHVEAERRWMMALVEGRRGNYLSAAWKARGARSRLADLEEDHPDFADPLMALGLTRVAVATLPRSYRFVLRILGFRGDTEGGVAQLERAAKESVTNRYPARAARALLDLVLFEEDASGTNRLRALHADTPESLLSAYLLTFALTEERAIEEADDVLRDARAEARRPGYAQLDYLDYFSGYVRFVKNDFSAAAEALSHYLSAHAGDALRAQALLYRGWALEMSAGWGAAQPVYAQVAVFRDFDADRWAARWAARRAKARMSAADSTLLLARTAFDAAREGEAESHARAVLYAGVAGTTPDDRAEAAYRLGRIYDVQGRHDDALVHYRQAVQLRGDQRAKWAPYALYHIGRIHAERGNADGARLALKQAIDWPTPYDFSDGLEQMATHLRDGG